MLGEFPRVATLEAAFRQLGESDLAVARRRRDQRIARQGQELALEHVGAMSRLVLKPFGVPLPIPEDDVEVVRSGRENFSVGVEVERVDASGVAVQLGRQLEATRDIKAAHAIPHESRRPQAASLAIDEVLNEGIFRLRRRFLQHPVNVVVIFDLGFVFGL